jgi:hypothetical protein
MQDLGSTAGCTSVFIANSFQPNSKKRNSACGTSTVRSSFIFAVFTQDYLCSCPHLNATKYENCSFDFVKPRRPFSMDGLQLCYNFH